MSHDVFISYSTKDSAVATRVCSDLEHAGVRCWMAPRDVEAGAAYDESIIDAIEGSRAMILVFSGHSNASEGVLNEIRNARSLRPPLTVIPFRIEDVPLSKALRFHLTAAQWIDALGPDVDAPVKELAARLKRTAAIPAAVEQIVEPEADEPNERETEDDDVAIEPQMLDLVTHIEDAQPEPAAISLAPATPPSVAAIQSAQVPASQPLRALLVGMILAAIVIAAMWAVLAQR